MIWKSIRQAFLFLFLSVVSLVSKTRLRKYFSKKFIVKFVSALFFINNV